MKGSIVNDRQGICRIPRDRAERGSVSVQVFILLVFLSVLLSGGAMTFAIASRSLGNRMSEGDIEERLLKASDQVIRALSDDPTPEADSILDPVWNTVQGLNKGEVKVRLEDASSAINLNWIGKNLFSKTDLKWIFRSGKNEEQLQQYREDTGFHQDIESGYGDFIVLKDLNELCTTYGYANVNVTDEFALRRLATLRTGSATVGDQFHAKIQDALRARKIVTAGELRAFLGPDYAALFPVINAEPVYNVHFLPPEILRAIVAYPDYEVANPESVLMTISSIVGTGEITPDRLKGVLGKEAPHRLYEYLGTVTWFWRIVAECGNVRLLTVVARIPSEPGADGVAGAGRTAEWSILERRILR